jgi:nitrate reductase gamma subunit
VEVFHGLAALALVVFLAGAIGRVRFWLSGSLPAADTSDQTGALALARRGLSILLLPQTLCALFWNGLLLRQVWQESRLRWLIHLTVSWSFVGLFAIGSLGNMASDLGAPLEKDDAWFAAFNDSMGLALLVGLALALGRRYVSPKPYTKNLFEDAALLVILALLGVGGLLLEAGRYLKEGTSASVGGYAFLGYPLSQAVEPLDWDWALVYDWLWWTHSLLALGLVAYLPYSKLFHLFTSPLAIALDAGDADSPGRARGAVEREARGWPA